MLCQESRWHPLCWPGLAWEYRISRLAPPPETAGLVRKVNCPMWHQNISSTGVWMDHERDLFLLRCVAVICLDCVYLRVERFLLENSKSSSSTSLWKEMWISAPLCNKQRQARLQVLDPTQLSPNATPTMVVCRLWYSQTSGATCQEEVNL